MKKIFNFNTIALFAFAILLLAIGTDSAFAAEAKDVAGRAKGQIEAFVELLGAAAYILGVGFGIRTAMKLKEYNDSKGQVPLSAPMWNGIVAALLIALPSLMSTLSDSLWGQGAAKTDITGNNMKTIN